MQEIPRLPGEKIIGREKAVAIWRALQLPPHHPRARTLSQIARDLGVRVQIVAAASSLLKRMTGKRRLKKTSQPNKLIKAAIQILLGREELVLPSRRPLIEIPGEKRYGMEKALEIMRELERTRNTRTTIAEIAAKYGVPRGTVHLISHQLKRQTGETRKTTRGPRNPRTGFFSDNEINELTRRYAGQIKRKAELLYSYPQVSAVYTQEGIEAHIESELRRRLETFDNARRRQPLDKSNHNQVGALIGMFINLGYRDIRKTASKRQKTFQNLALLKNRAGKEPEDKPSIHSLTEDGLREVNYPAPRARGIWTHPQKSINFI